MGFACLIRLLRDLVHHIVSAAFSVAVARPHSRNSIPLVFGLPWLLLQIPWTPSLLFSVLVYQLSGVLAVLVARVCAAARSWRR